MRSKKSSKMLGIRVAATSDLHGNLPDIPKCDILVVCGDIGPLSSQYHYDIDYAKKWLTTHFTDWLLKANVPVVGIAGNHDFAARDSDIMEMLPWNYLLDSSCNIYGCKFWGSPWTPKHSNWAFMANDNDLVSKWELIPDDTDILLTHGPPYNLGDRNSFGDCCGSMTLKDWRYSADSLPRMHFFGHIHECSGEGDGHSWHNVSLLDKSLNVQEVQVFDL